MDCGKEFFVCWFFDWCAIKQCFTLSSSEIVDMASVVHFQVNVTLMKRFTSWTLDVNNQL